jgi:hypothetical protein
MSLACATIRESENTQPPRLRFRALLTENGAQECNFTEREVRPWRILGISHVRISPKFGDLAKLLGQDK